MAEHAWIVSQEVKFTSGKRIALAFEIEYSLQRLMESEIELQEELARMRAELTKRPDYNVADIYCSIQKEGPCKPLEPGSLRVFVRANGDRISEDDE